MDYVATSATIEHLAAGEQVQVLFWRGDAQGIKAPGGPVAYADESAATRPTEDIGFQMFGLFVLLIGAPVPVGWVLTRRGGNPARVGVIQASMAGLSLVALAEAVGVLSDGPSGALTAFEVVAGIVFVIAMLIAYGRLRRRR